MIFVYLFLPVLVWNSASINKYFGGFTTDISLASTLPTYLCIALAAGNLNRCDA